MQRTETIYPTNYYDQYSYYTSEGSAYDGNSSTNAYLNYSNWDSEEGYAPICIFGRNAANSDSWGSLTGTTPLSAVLYVTWDQDLSANSDTYGITVRNSAGSTVWTIASNSNRSHSKSTSTFICNAHLDDLFDLRVYVDGTGDGTEADGAIRIYEVWMEVVTTDGIGPFYFTTTSAGIIDTANGAVHNNPDQACDGDATTYSDLTLSSATYTSYLYGIWTCCVFSSATIAGNKNWCVQVVGGKYVTATNYGSRFYGQMFNGVNLDFGFSATDPITSSAQPHEKRIYSFWDASTLGITQTVDGWASSYVDSLDDNNFVINPAAGGQVYSQWNETRIFYQDLLAGPTSLTVTATGYGAIRTEWSAVAGASGYRVHYNAGSTYVNHVHSYNEVSATVLSYVTTGLAGEYYFKVGALAEYGEGTFTSGDYSATAVLQDIGGDTPPNIENYTITDSSGNTVSYLDVASATGVNVGDLLVIIIGNDDTATPTFTTTYAGWTKIDDYGNSSAAACVGAFYKIAEVGDGTVRINNSGSMEHWAMHMRITGHNPDNPIGYNETFLQWSGTDYDYDPMTGGGMALTTVNSNSLVIAAGAYDGADASFTISGTDWSQVGSDIKSGTTSTDASGAVAQCDVVTPGTTNAITFDASLSDGWSGIIFSVNSIPAGGGVGKLVGGGLVLAGGLVGGRLT